MKTCKVMIAGGCVKPHMDEYPCHGLYGVWAVTPTYDMVKWEKEGGPKPLLRWNITHVPSGYSILGQGANLENMPGLASSNPAEITKIEGLAAIVHDARWAQA